MPLLVSSSLMIAMPTLTKGVPFVMRRTIFGSCLSAENALQPVDQLVGIHRFAEASVNVSGHSLLQFRMKRATGNRHNVQVRVWSFSDRESGDYRQAQCPNPGSTARQELCSMRPWTVANAWHGMLQYWCASSRLHISRQASFVGINHDDGLFHWMVPQSGRRSKRCIPCAIRGRMELRSVIIPVEQR